jgi:hypothetical protein
LDSYKFRPLKTPFFGKNAVKYSETCFSGFIKPLDAVKYLLDRVQFQFCDPRGTKDTPPHVFEAWRAVSGVRRKAAARVGGQKATLPACVTAMRPLPFAFLKIIETEKKQGRLRWGSTTSADLSASVSPRI